MGGSSLSSLILLLIPAIAGIVVAMTKKAELVDWLNNASAWWDRHYLSLKPKAGFFVGLWRAMIWGFHKLHKWTEGVEEASARAGLRVALFFYVGGLSLVVIGSLIYLAVVLALILVGIWVLFKIFGNDSDSSGDREYSAPLRSRKGTSRTRRDWLGDEYVEHRDEEDRVVGRSEVRKDWLGDSYVERSDADGNVVETSRDAADWLGDEYTEHRNADGERTGQSRTRRDWLGDDYVEHRDAEGTETGRSTDRTDWLGDPYSEHKPRD